MNKYILFNIDKSLNPIMKYLLKYFQNIFRKTGKDIAVVNNIPVWAIILEIRMYFLLDFFVFRKEKIKNNKSIDQIKK